MCKWNTQGFILIETLPAMLLVLVLLIVSMNVERIRMRLVEEEDMVRAKLVAYGHVSAKWKDSPGSLAALSKRSKGDSWEVIQFPDSNWLPRNQVKEAGVDLWRRRIVYDEDGNSFWHIEVYHPRAGRWRWWSDSSE
jgi:hypothetical protein